MTVPNGPELAILQSPTSRVDYRMAITIRSRYWDGPRTVDFATLGALSAEEFFFTQYTGPPTVNGSGLNIQSYGGPPREYVETRPHYFPSDPTLDIDVDIWATFPAADPIYSAVITVGSIYQFFGVDAEPLRVAQHGTAVLGTTSSLVGRIMVSSGGVTDTIGFFNDQAEHKYSVRWRPGTNTLTVLVDDVVQIENDDVGFAVQPLYIAYGLPQSTRSVHEFDPIAEPILLVRRHSVTGPTYETSTVPAWVTPNLGRTLEEVAEGELYTQDGKEWAVIPQRMIADVSARGGRDVQADVLDATLNIFDPDDPEALNIIGTEFEGRHVTLDLRTTDRLLGSTRWVRRAAVAVDKDHWAGGKVQFSGRDRAMSRLDVFLSRAYTSITANAESEGTFEGFNIGYSLAEALADIVTVADSAAGELLGPVTALILAPSINPKSLSSGAQSLAAAFVEVCDRSVLQVYRSYDIAGQARYAQINVGAYLLGSTDDAAVREFFGYDRPGENIQSFAVDHSRHDGLGQVSYRQNHPAVGDELMTIQSLPLVGAFPSVQYPPGDRILNDTLSFLEVVGLSPLLDWPIRTPIVSLEDVEIGGVARLRFRRENQMRHRGTLELLNDPFPETCEIVSVDDPNETGTPPEDRWMIHGWTMSSSGQGSLTTTLDLINVDWARAILRANP